VAKTPDKEFRDPLLVQSEHLTGPGFPSNDQEWSTEKHPLTTRKLPIIPLIELATTLELHAIQMIIFNSNFYSQ
jgi:hypothetical protein